MQCAAKHRHDSLARRSTAEHFTDDAMTLKILLVDDQTSTRLMVQAMLEHAGYVVLECSTGRDALAALASESFGFALIDLNLPDMSGLELLTQHDAADGHIPPAFGITSMPIANLLSSAQAAGMCGLLRKPISLNALTQAMAAAMSQVRTADFVVVGERPIDPKVLVEIRAIGDDALIERFVDQAIEDARRCIEQLATLDGPPDADAWRMTTQTLHGVALTLGARSLANATADAVVLSNEQLFERAKGLPQDFARLLDEATDWITQHATLLTTQEIKCLRLAAAGLATKGIADKLAIAEPTVKFHLNNAAVKLDARGRVQTVAKALEQGAI